MTKIAVLGWGSLIWDPRNLQIIGEWNEDGPLLPIEFARISEDGRLSLVLYPYEKNNQTLWAYSAFENLYQAKENLREREGTIMERIGYVSIPEDLSNCQAVPSVNNTIREWAEEKGLGAVIWTDLPYNPYKFKKKTRMDLNEDNAIKYLRNLEGEESLKAEEYIRKAPEQITTRLRRRIEKDLGWTYERK